MLQNTGSDLWSDVTMRHVDGPLMSGSPAVPVTAVPPGESTTVLVELISPSMPGTARSTWQLCGPNGLFGPRIWCEIESVAAPVFGSKFIRDVTLPDDCEVAAASSELTKVWRLKNTGTVSWAGVHCVSEPGDHLARLAPAVAVAPLGPGEEGDVRVALSPLEEKLGLQRSTWSLVDPQGCKFGHPLWASINVTAGALPPPPPQPDSVASGAGGERGDEIRYWVSWNRVEGENPTLADYNIQKESTLHLVLRLRCVAAPVPALFGAHLGTTGVHFLQSAAAALTASAADASAIVDALGGSIAVPPQTFPDAKLLDDSARTSLMRIIDEHRLTTDEGSMDLRLTLSVLELQAAVGAAAMGRLFELFGSRPTVIRLRRVEASADHDPKCVAFHTDYSLRTLQCPLNEDYDGGELVWVVDGGIEVPGRAAGSATIHTAGVVHGVTAMTRGVRYGIFLCKLPAEADVDTVGLGYLLGPAEEQLCFFERALEFLDTASDALLHDCAHEYHHFLLETIRSEDSDGKQPAASFETELLWRAHLLGPAAYAKDCVTLRGGQVQLIGHSPLSSVDDYDSRTPAGPVVAPAGMPATWHSERVAAVRRQEGFMRQMLELRSAGAASAKHIAAELRSYHTFLSDAASAEHTLHVPGPILDLVWHTHMLDPERYVRESIAISGQLIDHDDK
jgi:hypothetical protein